MHSRITKTITIHTFYPPEERHARRINREGAANYELGEVRPGQSSHPLVDSHNGSVGKDRPLNLPLSTSQMVDVAGRDRERNSLAEESS